MTKVQKNTNGGCMEKGCRWTCLTLVIAIVAIIYIVSPIDLIPEAVLGPGGYIEDIIVFVAALVGEGVISWPLLKKIFSKKG